MARAAATKKIPKTIPAHMDLLGGIEKNENIIGDSNVP